MLNSRSLTFNKQFFTSNINYLKHYLNLSDNYNTLFFFSKNRKLVLNKMVQINKSINSSYSLAQYLFYTKIYLVGLGYKNFVLGNILYILVGDANYLLFDVPASIKLFCKKNQIYMLSNNKVDLFAFSVTVKKIKKINLYKGKGLIDFKNFKFTKLKTGKKQKFM